VRALPFLLAAVVASACAPAPDRDVRLERLAVERRALEQTLEQLEVRLTRSRARVQFWERVRQDHEALSARRVGHAGPMAMWTPHPPAWLGGPRVAAAPPWLEPSTEREGGERP
jgi:hypothetical protein